jgi:predicted GNAT family N-acyltransferase
MPSRAPVAARAQTRHLARMSTQPDHGAIAMRRYHPSDQAGCLALFDANTPEFFAAGERDDFVRFLEKHATHWAYQVLERDGRLVACGGFAIEDDGTTASLCWGMVDRKLHREGLGTALTKARLSAAAATPGITRVKLDTSQHTYAFYARFGFKVVKIMRDGYGPDLDRYDMLLAL